MMVYPPGIPIFIPGEMITADNLAYIKENIEDGLPVQCLEDHSLVTIKVIQQSNAIR
jgi:lysine decarboxylase